MRKTIYLLLAFLCLMTSCSKEKNKFILKGEISGLSSDTLLVYYQVPEFQLDTIFCKNGIFEYVINYLIQTGRIKDQKELSEVTGITETTISRILHDKVKEPSKDTLRRLNAAFDYIFNMDYLNGKKCIEVPSERRAGNGLTLGLRGARGNNLKNVDIDFPLGMFVGISGVSGSGKSSLINETLMPILKNRFYNAKLQPLPYDEIVGVENVDKLIEIDQSPIGRTPRSNPATFTGVFNDIRTLFEATPDAKVRGFKAGRFSFNVPGGRCEECKGAGIKVIEMNFLPSVNVVCSECRGRRYKDDTLAVKYKGKNINDVLEMPISEAYEFFENIPSIAQKLKAMVDVGLGYVRLGQSAVTLSGGESQRMKLAAELARKGTGNTVYILDEPTTGLHFDDIKVLLGVLQQLVDQGNTVIIIEHNLDVLKSVDYIFDMGPEGGRKGGMIVAAGTPEQLAADPDSVTGPFLKEIL